MARRGLVVLVVLAVSAGGAVLALGVRTDFSPERMFTDDGAQRQASADLRAHFGNTDNVLVVLVQAPDVLAPAPLTYVRDLSNHLAAQPYVDNVASITTVPLPRRTGTPRPAHEVSLARVAADVALGRLHLEPIIGDGALTDETSRAMRAALADAPLLEGQLIARDRTVAVIAVLLASDRRSVDQLEPAVEDVEAYLRAHALPAGVRADLNGLPFIRVDVIRAVEADQMLLFPAALVVILLLLYASFRWAPAVVLPLMAVGASAAVLMGLMGAVGEELNIINNIVPILVIVIGISDSIHLVNRYGEELGTGLGRTDAARSALQHMVVPLFLTSFTTAVGFGSLVMSQLPVLGRFGVTAAIGVLVAYAVTISFLPAALSFAYLPKRPLTDARTGNIERAIAPVVALVLRHRLVILLGGALLMGSAAMLARGVPVDTAVNHQYDQDSPVGRSLAVLEDKLGGVRPVEVGVHGPPGRMDDPDVLAATDRVANWARGTPGVLLATTWSDLLHEAWFVGTGDPAARRAALDDPDRIALLAGMLERGPRRLGDFITPDRAHTRIGVQLADIGGKATVAFADQLRAQLDAVLPPDVTYTLGGEGYVSSAGLTTLTRDLFGSLLLASLVIFGFMALILRSLRLGLISIPPNLLPLVATLGYLRLRGIPLSPATVIIFSISIGLAVDGTIHLLARFREELDAGQTRQEALAHAVLGTGKAVVVSYVSLIVGFTVFQLSSFVPIRQFGELISVTVAMCLASTLIVLPALLSVAWKRG
jgi:hypothetical protein